MITHNRVVDAHAKCGEQFEDPHFPSDPLVHGARWLRPQAVFGVGAALFAPGVSGTTPLASGERLRAEWKAGRLGDTALLSALATLGVGRARSLFVSTCGAQAGMYTVQFWSLDEWTQVMIDDRIPCDARGEPLFAHGGAWSAAVSARRGSRASPPAVMDGANHCCQVARLTVD